jgi:hypothetical protein
MSDEAIAAAVERFVKKVSFAAQKELERVLRAAIASGQLQGHETLTAAVTVSNEKVGLMATIYSKIEL